jgi:hypothetical protein
LRGKNTSINWRNGYKRGEEGKKEGKEMRKGKGTGMQGFGKEGQGGIGGKGNDIRHGRKE